MNSTSIMVSAVLKSEGLLRSGSLLHTCSYLFKILEGEKTGKSPGAIPIMPTVVFQNRASDESEGDTTF